MEKLSRIIPNKKKKKVALEEKRRQKEEELLRIEVIRRGGLLYPSESLQDAMRTPRSPREVVISPRPLPEEVMKEAAPRKEKTKRASLNGMFFSCFFFSFFSFVSCFFRYFFFLFLFSFLFLCLCYILSFHV